MPYVCCDLTNAHVVPFADAILARSEDPNLKHVCPVLIRWLNNLTIRQHEARPSSVSGFVLLSHCWGYHIYWCVYSSVLASLGVAFTTFDYDYWRQVDAVTFLLFDERPMMLTNMAVFHSTDSHKTLYTLSVVCHVSVVWKWRRLIYY